MILFKTIEAEDVLYAVANLLKDDIPKDIKKSKAKLYFEFKDDYSVEVFLIVPEEVTN